MRTLEATELRQATPRLGSYHNEGEERFEIFVAHTNTEGCLATRSGLLHVLLDVPSRTCGWYRENHKNETWAAGSSTKLYMLSTIN